MRLFIVLLLFDTMPIDDERCISRGQSQQRNTLHLPSKLLFSVEPA